MARYGLTVTKPTTKRGSVLRWFALILCAVLVPVLIPTRGPTRGASAAGTLPRTVAAAGAFTPAAAGGDGSGAAAPGLAGLAPQDVGTSGAGSDTTLSPGQAPRRGGTEDTTLGGMNRNRPHIDTTLSPAGRSRRGGPNTTTTRHDRRRGGGLYDDTGLSRHGRRGRGDTSLSPSGRGGRRGGAIDTMSEPGGGAAARTEEPAATRGATVSGIASMTATLVDRDVKARKMEASVQVNVRGVRLVDPNEVGEQANPGQGHIHYQVDDGPVIATTATRLSFHGLTSGSHKILVVLAANDHTPLGPQQTLNVTIP